MTISRDALEQEIAKEQAHVDRVYANLDVAAESAKELARQGREIFVSDRADFFREEDGTALFERDAFAYQAAKRLAILDAEHEGLVFGRLDLNDGEVRYIGRIGVRDDDYEPLVIDWRAPAAEPFYRATQVSPMDVIRRRVLRCRDDKVTGIEDDLLDSEADTDLQIFGEGALMAAVTRARGRQMKDIVSTIQAEQDEAIRAPYRGVTVIAGGPGTGKTVVALHRAAYLLYTNRARLEQGGVLVVGPSAVFMNYIERVLPSLGEDSVTLRSIGQVAMDTLGLGSERVDGATAATAKGSLRMLKVLRRLVRLPINSEEPRARVTVKGEVLTVEGSELEKIRDSVLANQRFNAGRSEALKQVVHALAEKIPDDVDVDPDEALELIREHPGLSMFMNAWWPSLGAARVLARLRDREVLGQVGRELSEAEREAVVESFEWLDAHDVVQSVPREWSVADIALLDELVNMLGPEPEEEEDDPTIYIEGGEEHELVGLGDRFARERTQDPDEDPQNTYAHLLIDEAQDVTPMQWRMLRRRGPQASWTIVGDPAQSSYPVQSETEKSLKEVIGKGQHRQFTLSTNYRSPSEVFDLAAKVITKVHPDADLPKAIRSTGIEPKLLATTAEEFEAVLREQVLGLAGQVTGTIGIIVPPSRIAQVTRFVLSDPRLRAFEERVLVVTALQAKGLEYDGVVIVAPDDIVDEAPGRERVLYVALTRATQRMVSIDITTTRWRDLLA